jgi:hypothetical protein
VIEASLEKGPRPATAALVRSAGAWVLWFGGSTAAASAALDMACAIRDGGARSAMVTGVGAAAALGILFALAASLLVVFPVVLLRRTRLASAVVRARAVIGLIAGTGVAWWLTDPLKRRMTVVYLMCCFGTGLAVAISCWLARKRATLPEVVAALIVALAGAAITWMIPASSYEELQDIAFVALLAGALAASAAAFPWLEARKATPLIALAALLVSLVLPWTMDAVAPEWRLAVHTQQPSAARLARAVRLVIDVDRDGFSPVLQGGDCDDLDAAIHPLAIDRPGGLDANCNGVDAPATTTDAEQGLAPPSGDPSLPEDAIDRLLLITVDCWRADALDPVLMPEVSAFAAGGMVFERLYAAGANTTRSLPMVVGVGPRGPWVGDIAASHGIRVDAAIAGAVPASLWGFRRARRVSSMADQTTHAALELIDATAGKRFVWLHYFDLHSLAQYSGESPAPPGPPRLPASYRIGVRHVDRAIGRLLAELDRRGQLGRTMVVMTGDHGEGLGAHGVSNHAQSGFDEVIRVPGILVGPGIPPANVPHLVSHRDLPATLLGLLGLSDDAVAAEQFGRSWLRLRAEPQHPLHSFVVVRSDRRVSGRFTSAPLGVLVDDRHKLVAGLEDGLFELYDLVDDPHETRNLASVEPDVRDRLWRQLATVWDVGYQSLAADR